MIFDIPMANLSETEDKEIFQSFYQFLYKLISDELKGQQIILIDKEFHGPIHNIPDLIIKEERMDENNPLF